MVCLCSIPSRFVNASKICEQNSLSLSVTTSLGTPKIFIKCSSMDFCTVPQSLDTIGVIIRKPEPRSLMLSKYLCSREAGSGQTRFLCIIFICLWLLGKLLIVWRLC